MLLFLQLLVFTGCVLLDLAPKTEVQCRFDAPIVTWSAPAPAAVTPPAPPLED